MLFKCKFYMFSDFTREKNLLLQDIVARLAPPCPCPASLIRRTNIWGKKIIQETNYASAFA